MRANITKGFIGYVFLLVLGGACIAVGAVTFDENIPSAVFGVVLGVVLLGVGVLMAFRKR
jgi:hypothetical protein